MTLEAAVALPLLLCVGVALTWLLLAARIESSLREAVDEAVTTTAAHTYPLDLVARVYHHNETIQSIENQVQRLVPHSIKAMIQERRQNATAQEQTAARRWSDSSFHRGWAKPFVASFVDRGANGKPLLDPNRLVVVSALLPTFASEETSYFGLTVEYRIALPIPFFSRDLVFRAAAIERCWVGEKL